MLGQAPLLIRRLHPRLHLSQTPFNQLNKFKGAARQLKTDDDVDRFKEFLDQVSPEDFASDS